MLSAEKIIGLQRRGKIHIDLMDKLLKIMNDVVDRLNADHTRSREYIKEACNIERGKITPLMAKEIELLREINYEAAAQKQFWESKPLLLSLQTFSKEPEKDAQIRLSYSNELSSMPLPLLDLMLMDARNDVNLPLIYQCWRAGASRGNEPHFNEIVDLALDNVVIPDQDVCLAAISQCWSNLSRAESIINLFMGRASDPVRNLQIARQQVVTEKLINTAEILAPGSLNRKLPYPL